jgi:hypothetical protein
MESSKLKENLVEIRSRQVIRLGFALVMLVICFIVVFGISRLTRVQDTLAEIVAHEQEAIEMLFRMQQAARERSVLLYGVASTIDPFERDQQLLQHGQLGGQFNQARLKLSTLQLDETEATLLEQLNGHVDNTRKTHGQLREVAAEATGAKPGFTGGRRRDCSFVCRACMDLHQSPHEQADFWPGIVRAQSAGVQSQPGST